MSLFKNFKADSKAGLVVFLVALPLCLGVALAQGAPLLSGIIAGVIGGIIISLISGSKLSVSGPAAGLTSIVLVSIQTLGSYEAFLAALVCAGILQAGLGFMKAGIIGNYFPLSVIKGMLAAIGIILIIKQIPHLVGYDKDYGGDFTFIQMDGENSFSALVNGLNLLSPGSAIIGVVSLVILFVMNSKKAMSFSFIKAIPAALIVVVVGVGLNHLFSGSYPWMVIRDEHLVNLPEINSWDTLKASLIFPDFSALKNPKIYEIIFTLAVVASLETLLCIEAVDKLDPENNMSPTNRELIAQGVGNTVSGMIGGIPITSVIVRSSANINAGGKSQMSAIIHGVLFLVSVLFIPFVLEMIPLSCLAAILIYTGFKLAHPSVFANTIKMGVDQWLPFVVTIVVMLLTDLLKGVFVGFAISIFFILKQNVKAPFKVLKEEMDGRLYFFVQLSNSVTFINKGKINEFLHSIPEGAKVEIDGGRSAFIDKDILEVIAEFKHSAKRRKIDVVTEGIQEVAVLSAH